MPYGKTSVLGATLVAVPTTGVSLASWLVGAVTLLMVVVALVQLARPGSALRP